MPSSGNCRDVLVAIEAAGGTILFYDAVRLVFTINKVRNNGNGGAGYGIILIGTNPFFVVANNAIFGNKTGAISNAAGYSANQIMVGNTGAATPNSLTGSLIMYNDATVSWDVDKTQNIYDIAAGGVLDLAGR